MVIRGFARVGCVLGISASLLFGPVVVVGANAEQQGQSKRQKLDKWAGEWNYVNDIGNGETRSGRMELRVNKGGHDEAYGKYFGESSGRIWGDLHNADGDKKPFGKYWCGKFQDDFGANRNKGRFCATLYKDNGNFHFYGWYKPKKNWFTSYEWAGSKVVD